ncbi:MAG: electron transport complex subunit RsxE [Bacilli bacterium]
MEEVNIEKKSKKTNSSLSILLNGIFNENPTFRMLLGMCPTLAITTKLSNSLGMGLSVLFVLVFSNLFISLIRKIVPSDIRIPVYIVIIATLVTVVSLLLQAFLPDLNKSLGAFVALIVVNCIILGRAEAFASKNKPLPSILDAIGMALGFTLAISIIAIIREFLSSGTITVWGNLIIDCTGFYTFLNIEPSQVFTRNIGAFLILGLLIGIITSVSMQIKKKKASKQEEAKL